MILYHGGTETIERPEIIIPATARDFGIGFYTTNIIDQAIRWAKRKSRTTSRPGHQRPAIVNLYDFDESALSILKVNTFPEASSDWLDMVVACRSDVYHKHGYDIVTGKIADDNVGETILYVLQNIMRREDAIERLRFEQINHQICFCSKESLQYLNFLEARTY